MTIDFSEIFQKRAQHIVPGLERMREALLSMAFEPKKRCRVIVAGTNGKGTTSGYIAALLESEGLRVGLYTSPHLRCFSERYYMTGLPIDDEFMHREWLLLRSRLPESLSFFEIATSLALHLFNRHELDVEIYEVGMGGRWDATNIIDPQLSVIVGVDFDHQAFLGETIEAIAAEKLGIVRSTAPAILGSGGAFASPFEIRDAAKIRATRPLLWFEHGRDFTHQTTSISIGERNWRIDPNMPDYKKHNMSVAMAAIHLLLPKALPATLDINAIEARAMRFPSLAGRSQRLLLSHPRGQHLYLDVAHNPDGIGSVCQIYPQDCVVLFSAMADKSIDTMLDLLRRKFSTLVVFRNQNERSLNQLSARHADLNWAENLDEAWKQLPPGRPWLMCGSVAAVGEVIAFLEHRHLCDFRAESSVISS